MSLDFPVESSPFAFRLASIRRISLYSSYGGAGAAKYINTNETPVYNKSSILYALDITKMQLQRQGEAVIMEGEFDVISSFQAGISNVVAIKGSRAYRGTCSPSKTLY